MLGVRRYLCESWCRFFVDWKELLILLFVDIFLIVFVSRAIERAMLPYFFVRCEAALVNSIFVEKFFRVEKVLVVDERNGLRGLLFTYY